MRRPQRRLPREKAERIAAEQCRSRCQLPLAISNLCIPNRTTHCSCSLAFAPEPSHSPARHLGVLCGSSTSVCSSSRPGNHTPGGSKPNHRLCILPTCPSRPLRAREDHGLPMDLNRHRQTCLGPLALPRDHSEHTSRSRGRNRGSSCRALLTRCQWRE